jgi:hypothetical protein
MAVNLYSAVVISKFNPHSRGYNEGGCGCQDAVQLLKTLYHAVRWIFAQPYQDAPHSKKYARLKEPDMENI